MDRTDLKILLNRSKNLIYTDYQIIFMHHDSKDDNADNDTKNNENGDHKNVNSYTEQYSLNDCV